MTTSFAFTLVPCTFNPMRIILVTVNKLENLFVDTTEKTSFLRKPLQKIIDIEPRKPTNIPTLIFNYTKDLNKCRICRLFSCVIELFGYIRIGSINEVQSKQCCIDWTCISERIKFILKYKIINKFIGN